MGKKCDLCGGVARMYCESDQASLCWDCDGKVHGANFLVAKHTRCLLCSACQSRTPWNATGLGLGPTFCVCDSCVARKNAASSGGSLSTNRGLTENRDQDINCLDNEEVRPREDNGNGAESYDDDEEEDESDEYSDEDEGENEGEDGVDDEEAENQVVPWAAPPLTSSSSSDGGYGSLVAKRTRDCSEDEIGCSSAQDSNCSRPLKRPSRDEPAFKSTAAINSISRFLEGKRTFNGADESSSSLIFAISKPRRDISS